MTGLLLVAASGLAREVLAVPGLIDRYDDMVVVDDDPRRWGTTCGEVTVLGSLDLVRDLPGYDVLLCAGSGAVRRTLEGRLLAGGLGPDRFATVIHPTASVAAGCEVGAGSILLARTTLTVDVVVGRQVVLMPGVTLTHDDVVEDFATLCAGVSLGGGVRVGSAAYLGMNSSVREGLTMGAGGLLGMGAALTQDLPAGETWAGVPAHPIRQPVEVSA